MDVIRQLDTDTVKVPLEAIDKEEAIAELLELLVRAGRVQNREAILEALYEREAKGSTGIGEGVAIPHARHPEVEGAQVSAGVSKEGIDFDAIDGEDVQVVFLVVAEEDNPSANVEALAELGNLVQTPGIYDRLIGSNSADEFVKVLGEVQFQP